MYINPSKGLLIKRLKVFCIGSKDLSVVIAFGTSCYSHQLVTATTRKITLESAIEWIEEDELIEIAPLSVRIRKKSLDANERKRNARDKKNSK